MARTPNSQQQEDQQQSVGKARRGPIRKPPTARPDRPGQPPDASDKAGQDALEPTLEQLEEAHAENLKRMSSGAHLYTSTSGSLGHQTPPTAFLRYMHNTIREAGAPQDPVERMLIEQITLAHHNIGRLHSSAAAAKTVDEAKVYNAAAAKLLGEFRRTALALKQYREPTPARQYTMVRQQNIAAQQQVALVDGRGEKQDASKDSAHEKAIVNSKKGSNRALEYQPVEKLVPEESTPSRRREEEPVEVARLHARGAGRLASRRVEEPSLGESDGPEDARG